MIFWSLWLLGPILEHQTAKFELSGQFSFSRHPWGSWGHLSSGGICIWKISQKNQDGQNTVTGSANFGFIPDNSTT